MVTRPSRNYVAEFTIPADTDWSGGDEELRQDPIGAGREFIYEGRPTLRFIYAVTSGRYGWEVTQNRDNSRTIRLYLRRSYAKSLTAAQAYALLRNLKFD